MEASLPVVFHKPHWDNFGSGFIIKHDGQHYLVTAAHLSTMEPNPHKQWDEWPQTIRIPDAELPLFDNGQPKFFYLDCGDTISDVLIVGLDAAYANKALLYHVCFDPYAVNAPIIGQVVRAFGRVLVGNNPSPQIILGGTIDSAECAVFHHTALTRQGFSGGPVVDLKGRLSGMTIGSDDTGSIAITPEAIRKCLTEPYSLD